MTEAEPGQPAEPAARPEAGSAIVEFVLVSTLLLFLFLGIIQLGLVLYVRNTLVANAAEGARHGANLGVDPADGEGGVFLHVQTEDGHGLPDGGIRFGQDRLDQGVGDGGVAGESLAGEIGKALALRRGVDGIDDRS